MGIDLGGLFKDFLTDLIARVFQPGYGLFSVTSTGDLYPNPHAALAIGDSESLELFTFVGQVLGKAIFEDITIQPQFAHFFLANMPGRYNFLHVIDDLATLDIELHKNLKFLKDYEVQYSCLTRLLSHSL